MSKWAPNCVDSMSWVSLVSAPSSHHCQRFKSDPSHFLPGHSVGFLTGPSTSAPVNNWNFCLCLSSARTLTSTTTRRGRYIACLTAALKWCCRESSVQWETHPALGVGSKAAFLLEIIPSFIITTPGVIFPWFSYYWLVLNWVNLEDARPGNDYM